MSFGMQAIPGFSYISSCINEPNLAQTPSLCGKVFLLAQSNSWLYPSVIDQEKTPFFLPKILVDLSSHAGRIGLCVSLVTIAAPIGTIGNAAFSTFYVARFTLRQYGFGILCSKREDLVQTDWKRASWFAQGSSMDLVPIFRIFLAAGLYLAAPLTGAVMNATFPFNRDVPLGTRISVLAVGLIALISKNLPKEKGSIVNSLKFSFEKIVEKSTPKNLVVSVALLAIWSSPILCRLAFKANAVLYGYEALYNYSYSQKRCVEAFIPKENREVVMQEYKIV